MAYPAPRRNNSNHTPIYYALGVIGVVAGDTPTPTMHALIKRLHHAPLLPQTWGVFWTPNGDGGKKRSHWLRAQGAPDCTFAPPTTWAKKNVYFGINPSAGRRADWECSTNETIGAVNAFLAEFDGKDFVTKGEWLPNYVAPDLDRVATDTIAELAPQVLDEKRMAQRIKGRQRGALVQAENAAIDATFKLTPDLYMARAWAHIEALPQRPTAAWKSGGGYQCVWLLDETVYLFRTDGTRDLAQFERMAALQKKWVAWVGGDPAACDLRRIFRWPGSINFKPKYAPNFPTVDLLYCDLERTYALAALETLLPVDPPKKRTRRAVHIPAGLPVDLGDLGDVPTLPRHPAIDALNHATDLGALLEGYGYTDAKRGRLSRPGGDSGGVALHSNNTATIFSSADPLFCEHRITPAHAIVVYEFGGDVDAFMATLPGVGAAKETLAMFRNWLASPDAIEKLKEDGFRNAEQARRLLDTMLQKCEEMGSLIIAPGYAYLSKNSTIAKGGISRYLSRLFHAGYINLKLGKEAGEATVIELLPNPVLHNVNSIALPGTTVHVVQNWNIYREQRASEAFMNNHYAYSSTRTKATLPTLGSNGLGALMALQDGAVTIKEAAAAVGYSYDATARTLSRYVANGLVDVTVGYRGLKSYSLKEDWRAILKAKIPLMPTYAVQLVRHVAALKSRESIKRFYGEDEKADKVKAELERMAALLAKVKEAAGIIPFVQPDRVDKHEERRRRLTYAIVLGERALHRLPVAMTKPTDANKWRRKEYVKTLPIVQHNWPEFNAWAVVEYGAGWWAKLDETDILGRYKIFEFACERVPTIKWAGQQADYQAALIPCT